LHVCMCHSPIRYAWDLQHQYLRESNLSEGARSWLARWILHQVRTWDYRTANGVDEFIANSDFIARRIWKAYRREAVTIYPPVDTDGFSLQREKSDYYVTASRMVPYKRIDLVVETFSALRTRQLVVIGDGPDFEKIKRKAGPNVTLLGHAPFELLRAHLQAARAFVFAAEEDFGIAPLEAQACGTPVIAFAKGAAPETIRGTEVPRRTGVFFAEQSVGSLTEAIEHFESHRGSFRPEDCRDNALRFAPARFRQEFHEFVESRFAAFRARAARSGNSQRRQS